LIPGEFLPEEEEEEEEETEEDRLLLRNTVSDPTPLSKPSHVSFFKALNCFSGMTGVTEEDIEETVKRLRMERIRSIF
jgi:hypothetical protein